MEVGRTFWKGGNLNSEKPFGEIEELNSRANNDDYEDNGLPCEMLEIENGLAVCKIERDFGWEYKPVACREYPDGELCFAEAAEIINENF